MNKNIFKFKYLHKLFTLLVLLTLNTHVYAKDKSNLGLDLTFSLRTNSKTGVKTEGLLSIETCVFKESSESLYPNSMDWGKRCVSLSLSAAVGDNDCERIVDCVKSFL